MHTYNRPKLFTNKIALTWFNSFHQCAGGDNKIKIKLFSYNKIKAHVRVWSFLFLYWTKDDPCSMCEICKKKLTQSFLSSYGLYCSLSPIALSLTKKNNNKKIFATSLGFLRLDLTLLDILLFLLRDRC